LKDLTHEGREPDGIVLVGGYGTEVAPVFVAVAIVISVALLFGVADVLHRGIHSWLKFTTNGKFGSEQIERVKLLIATAVPILV
jgi:hypothetical protein